VRLGLAPPLRGARALLTASESTAAPHRPAHILTLRANRAGVATFTVQHGLENLGLTYADAEYPRVDFASRTLFIWGEPSTLVPEASSETRAKCIPLGRAWPAGSAPALARATGKRVAVFENLHWSRYPDSYRASFLEHLAAACRSFPDVEFLLRPHPAGQWLTALFQGRLPEAPNFTVAHPREAPWKDLTASSFYAASDAVITTPSTVALDAAHRGLPAAVASYGLPGMERYAPLPLLASAEDWTRFVKEALSSPADLVARGARFRDRVVLPEPRAARKIAERLLAQVRGA
jgi:hypothetical protein